MNDQRGPAVTDPDRLAAVRELLQPPDGEDAPGSKFSLERINRLATALLGVPVSLVSLVDDDRQIFAAQVGVEEPWTEGTPLSHSFCQHVVEDDAPLVVDDAREDDRLRENLAIPDLDVVAYCGVPIRTAGGRVVGSFCVIDSDPREWSDEEVQLVEDLAQLATSELVRRTAQSNDEQLATVLRRSLRAVLGGFRTVVSAGDLDVSDRAMYVAVVEREGRRLEQLLDELLTA